MKRFPNRVKVVEFIRELGFTGNVDLDFFAAYIQAQSIFDGFSVKDLASSLMNGIKGDTFDDYLERAYEDADYYQSIGEEADVVQELLDDANSQIENDLRAFYTRR